MCQGYTKAPRRRAGNKVGVPPHPPGMGQASHVRIQSRSFALAIGSLLRDSKAEQT